jgi:hypothetical protein
MPDEENIRSQLSQLETARYAEKPATDTYICCPACLKRFPAHSSMAGKLGRCGWCDAHFAINVTELRLGGEAAIVFEGEVMPRPEFFREGCRELARNASAVIRLAGEPVTPESVRRFVNQFHGTPATFSKIDGEMARSIGRWRGRSIPRVPHAAMKARGSLTTSSFGSQGPAIHR